MISEGSYLGEYSKYIEFCNKCQTDRGQLNTTMILAKSLSKNIQLCQYIQQHNPIHRKKTLLNLMGFIPR